MYVLGYHSRYFICHLLLLLFNKSQVEGYSSGAPEAACDSMVPSHPDPGNVGDPPFEIIVSQSSFKPAESINITLFRNDGMPFKGFMIQARRTMAVDDERIGSFVIDPDDGKTNCQCSSWSSCSVTHKDSSDKTSVNIVWIAPCTYEGDVVFRATFVETQSPSVYWAAVDMVNVTAEQGTGDECGTTQDDTFTGTSTLGTTTTPLLPIDLSNCGRDKGCFRSPADCEDSLTCEYLVTWVPREQQSQIDFEISAQVGTDQWTAIGLSFNDEMGEDSVTDCIYDETTQDIIIQGSWNDDSPNNIPLQNRTLGIVQGTSVGSYSNGIIHCTYTRWMNNTSTFGMPKSELNRDPIYDIDQPFHLLLAKGPASAGVKFPHLLVPSPLVSSEKIDLNRVSDVRGDAVRKRPLVITHGSLMLIAWMLLASIGVLMPRHFKPAWKIHMWFDKAIWFQIHRCVMTLVLTLTCIAFIVIFVEVGGYSKSLTDADAAHPILGIFVMILTIVNPLMALFRPHPGAKNRPLFNIAHLSVGTSAHVLAAVTMFLGTRLALAGMSEWARWIVLSFIVWHCIVELLLFLHAYLMNKSKRTITPSPSQIDLKSQLAKSSSTDSFDTSKNIQTSPSTVELVDVAQQLSKLDDHNKRDSIWRSVIIGLHCLVLLAFVITLIVDLN